MYYYKLKTNKRNSFTQKLKVDTLKEAKNALRVIGKDPKKYDFFSEEDVEAIKKEEAAKPLKLYNELSDNAKVVVDELEIADQLSEELIAEYQLQNDGEYFIECHWGSGCNSYLGDEQAVKDTYYEQANAPYDEAFDVTVQKIKNGRLIDCDVDVSITVDIEIHEVE